MKYDRNDPNQFYPPLDYGIERAVLVLRSHGIYTIESCQGGKEHSYPEPTVTFLGGFADGMKALSIALQHGMPIKEIRKVWNIAEREIHGEPVMQIVFYDHVPLDVQEAAYGVNYTDPFKGPAILPYESARPGGRYFIEENDTYTNDSSCLSESDEISTDQD